MLLKGLDTWYQLGDGVGACAECARALGDRLRALYGEAFVPFAADSLVLGGADGAFARDRKALQLASPLAAARRVILRARDAARPDEAHEGSGGELFARLTVGPLGALLAERVDGVFLEGTKTAHRLFSAELFRAAAHERPVAVELVDGDARSLEGAAALVFAAGCEVALDAAAGEQARSVVDAQRAFRQELRRRFRPTAPLGEVQLLYSPHCDHWTRGAHFTATAQLAEALTDEQVQYTISMGEPRGREPVLVAGAMALLPDQAHALAQHVFGGGTAVCLGTPTTVDAQGLTDEPPFDSVKVGEETRYGEGRTVLFPEDAAVASLVVAALGNRRRAIVLTGANRVCVKAFLDPERKLDLHIVNRGDTPLRGAKLHLSGAIVGSTRTGTLFVPDREQEKLTLTPSRSGVSTALPEIERHALLAISR